MIDPDRVLQPLRAEEGAIGRLETYGSASELADAVVSVRDAVDRSLRLLLRNDPGAPDELRLSALSPADLPHDRLISALRRRELISLGLAGSLHELERAAERAARDDVQAADADLARRVIIQLASEVRGRATVAVEPEAAAAAEVAVPDDGFEEVRQERPARRVLFIGALVVAALVVLVLGRNAFEPSAVERGIEAFRADDLESAQALFEEAVRSDSGNVTALVYLGRIYRRNGRYAEAARVLSAAEDHAPEDADVRRELGYLFMDLDRPAAAARQFGLARELDPDNDLNWIGLIRALRAADDPAAETWLERAPPDVKAALTTAPPRGSG